MNGEKKKFFSLCNSGNFFLLSHPGPPHLFLCPCEFLYTQVALVFSAFFLDEKYVGSTRRIIFFWPEHYMWSHAASFFFYVCDNCPEEKEQLPLSLSHQVSHSLSPSSLTHKRKRASPPTSVCFCTHSRSCIHCVCPSLQEAREASTHSFAKKDTDAQTAKNIRIEERDLSSFGRESSRDKLGETEKRERKKSE